METMDLNLGDSLKDYASVIDWKNPLIVFAKSASHERKGFLITRITNNEAEGLYRTFIRCGEPIYPHKATLILKDYELSKEGIWSEPEDYKELGSDWDNKLKEHGL